MSRFYCNSCDRLRNVRFHGYEEIQGEPVCVSCYTEVMSKELEDILAPSPQVFPTPRTISGATLPASRKPHGELGEPGKENNDE